MNPFPAKPLHKIGQVGSHNTYTTSTWTSHLDNVNAVELDVWPLSNWVVSHAYKAGAGHLEDYMKDLKKWRDAHPNHDLLTVFIEIKSKEGWKVGDFESILFQQFKTADLFRPMDLAQWGREAGYTGLSLRTLVKTHGWPDVSTKKNKIMFVLNGEGHVTETYLAERPVVNGGAWSFWTGNTPVCFMMSTLGDTRPGSEGIVIFNGEYNDFSVLKSAPDDQCLRRAYNVKTGNDEMGNGDPKPATALMTSKWINYLCYDDTKNAFCTDLP